ncbi:hypothetical protein GCM10022243_43350 [Saccharothrix violaceirubra]|uniref:Uncharacterized protein n=1 Tax=Saccharothrix violaceirubra TaxID=413306 RepID=A0A7W7T3Z8_9PSEU|nr:hypothetical protein [Saccharothrix violaceirubra]MBB4965622.1 hypothetical protein [Saccharothrix violaceirubra]
MLHTAWRAGEHDERVRDRLPRLRDTLADRLRHDRHPARGLLAGEPGARLALRAAITDTPPGTRWDACLLLDD